MISGQAVRRTCSHRARNISFGFDLGHLRTAPGVARIDTGEEMMNAASIEMGVHSLLHAEDMYLYTQLTVEGR